MKKTDLSSVIPPWIIIPFGGFLVLGLCYIGYFAAAIAVVAGIAYAWPKA